MAAIEHGDRYAARVRWNATGKLAEFQDALAEDAIKGEPVYSIKGDQVGMHREAAKMRLFADYAWGRPRKQAAPSWRAFEPADLDSLAGCRAVASSIMQAQVAGILDDEAATAYRSTVELAMRSLQMGASQDQDLRLGEAGGESIILDAGDPDIEGQLRQALEAINAPRHDDA